MSVTKPTKLSLEKALTYCAGRTRGLCAAQQQRRGCSW